MKFVAMLEVARALSGEQAAARQGRALARWWVSQDEVRALLRAVRAIWPWLGQFEPEERATLYRTLEAAAFSL